MAESAADQQAAQFTAPVVMPPIDSRTASAALAQRNEFIRAFVEHTADARRANG
jgi:hypothetical protein